MKSGKISAKCIEKQADLDKEKDGWDVLRSLLWRQGNEVGGAAKKAGNGAEIVEVTSLYFSSFYNIFLFLCCSRALRWVTYEPMRRIDYVFLFLCYSRASG